MGQEDKEAAESIGQVPVLETLPLFKCLPAASRAMLLRHSVLKYVAPGTVLFVQGDIPQHQCIVVSGAVHLFGSSTEGREVLIDTIRPSDLVIPAAVLTGSPYLMEARVLEPSRFLLIRVQAFRAAVASNPDLAQAVIGSLAGQFRGVVRQVKNLKLRSSIERVGCYILALAKRQGTPEQAILPCEKALIASELGITPESFSRALSALRDVGIEVHDRKIVIRDAARLAVQCMPDPLIDGPEIHPDDLNASIR